MILADENIDRRIISALREIPVKVVSIFEDYRGFSDRDIIELSKNLELIIITEDKDFGEWIFAHKVTNVSIILLRYHFSETEQMIQSAIWLINNFRDDLKGKYITITPKKIRVRDL